MPILISISIIYTCVFVIACSKFYADVRCAMANRADGSPRINDICGTRFGCDVQLWINSHNDDACVSCRTLMSTLSVPRALEYTGRALSIMFLLPECQVHGTGMPQVLQVIHHDNAPANTDGIHICDAASDLCEVKGLLHPGAALLFGVGMCCRCIAVPHIQDKH